METTKVNLQARRKPSTWITKQINTRNDSRGYRLLNAVLETEKRSSSSEKKTLIKSPAAKTKNRSVAKTVDNNTPALTEFILWPSYESTYGLSSDERQTAIEEWVTYFNNLNVSKTINSVKFPLVPYSSSSDEESDDNLNFAKVDVSKSNIKYQEQFYNSNAGHGRYSSLQHSKTTEIHVCSAETKREEIIDSTHSGETSYDPSSILPSTTVELGASGGYKPLIVNKSLHEKSPLSSPPSYSHDSDIDPEYIPDSSLSDESSVSTENISKEFTSDPKHCRDKLLGGDILSRSNYPDDISGSMFEENNSNSLISYEKIARTKNTVNDLSHLKHINNSVPHSSQEDETTKGNNKQKRIRAKNYCFFCETLVTTFARHLIRNHHSEIDVQRIISKPVESKERKELIALLRKKGNYLNSQTGHVKPVRKPLLSATSDSVLPCSFCLGYYAKKQIWRHRKTCSLRPQSLTKGSSQAAGQNVLLKGIKLNERLRQQVFPRMRADDISLAAKRDPLICSFGSRYLLTHREKHQINVTSRKMRELAKLLLQIQKIEPKISSLLQALKPENFDVIVEAAKVVGSYDPDKDVYHAPTYAMNISTSLKECCEIGITYALKKKHYFDGKTAAEAESELRTTILLLKSNWKVEISHQAANNLHYKKMNKVTIIPLASDLKTFKEWLIKQGNDAASLLQKDEMDISAYKQLVETVYCRVLLLCRKRVGELQRLPLEIYQTSGSKQSYEEFQSVIKPTEMILMKKFKRVVIQGKRKVTPVLFSFDVQEHISLLIKVRINFVDSNNPFLFANPGTTNPITGYKVLQKYTKKANLKIPEALTSRRLRKHLATISQLFQMSENDIEQLAAFMGHTPSIHRNEYRLPNDVFQTAKITKLLMMLESGEGAKNKGKSLDDLEVNLEEDLMEMANSKNDSDDDDDNDVDGGYNNNHDRLPLEELVEDNQPSTSSAVPKETPQKISKRELVKWTDEEKKIVSNFFKSHISKRKPPRKHECEQVIKENPSLLKNKTWVKIKVFVQNLYTKKQKMPK